MKNKLIIKIISFIVALTVAMPVATVNAKMILSKSETTKYINTIAKRQMNVVKNPSHSSMGGEWTVMGLARAGKITSSYKNKYKKNLKKVLDSKKGVLTTTSYTEYSRVVIALTSIGENPYNFYGYDVINQLAEFDNVAKQGLNGIAYALIALNSGEYDVSPQNGYDGKVGNREKYKDAMISSELSKGGWSIFGKKADPDMTAIAIQALAPYYKKDSKAKKAINSGIKVLSNIQKNNGSFASMGNENCESCSQVLTAMSAVGISVSDKRFVKNNNTVLDGLFRYYKNGAFKHLENTLTDQMSTDQAFYALVAYRKTLSNDPSLFNMKSVAVKKNKRKTKKQLEASQADQNPTTHKNNKKKKKKNKKENKVKNPETTTKNIVKETTKAKKNNEKEGMSLWWIWVILAVIVSQGLGFLIFRKKRK